MIRTYLFIFLLSILFTGTQAQPGDSIQKGPQPFEGVITYQVTFKGKGADDIQDLLPDSMKLWVKYPAFRIRYYGGMADTLYPEYVYRSGNNGHFIINHGDKKVSRILEIKDSTLKKPTASTEKIKILGLDGKKFILKTGDTTQSWVLNKTIFFRRDSTDSLNFGRPPFFVFSGNQIPLQFTRATKEVKITNTAIRMESKPLKEEDFEYPAGYRLEEFEGNLTRHPLLPELPKD